MRWTTAGLLPLMLSTTLALTGCFSTGDALRLTIDDPSEVVIDTVCSGCSTQVAATIAYASGAPGPADATFDLAQYRIDYTLEDGRPIDFYADAITGSVAEGETLGINLDAGGRSQREIIFDSFGSDEVTGTATVTLEGYDYDDTVWSPDPVEFAFVYKNIADEDSPVDTGL